VVGAVGGGVGGAVGGGVGGGVGGVVGGVVGGSSNPTRHVARTDQGDLNMRHTYSTLAIARRHPRLFSMLTAACRLEFYETKTSGTHVVAVHPRGLVHQFGVLWS
jgi:hypothetical protein